MPENNDMFEKITHRSGKDTLRKKLHIKEKYTPKEDTLKEDTLKEDTLKKNTPKKD